MTTTLYQLELDQTAVNCGASYVIQLKAGDFIIIDGGYFTAGEEDRLYHVLAERAVGTPVIAAWFFSHAHQDHVGNFIQFVCKHGASVLIQRLLYSFHPVDLSNVTGDWKSSDPATIKAFYETVEEHCVGVDKIELKTGDTFTFGELTLNVLYSYRDLYPEPASFNDYSTVIMTTVDHQKILWLGDICAKAADVILRHPEQIACDIVQIAHHGIDQHVRLFDLYAATGANVALWPAPDYGMVERKDKAVTHFLLYDLNIQEHLVSGYGTLALPLPYGPGLARKEKKALSLDRQPDPAVRFDCDGVPSPAFRYLTPECVEPATADTTQNQSNQTPPDGVPDPS